MDTSTLGVYGDYEPDPMGQNDPQQEMQSLFENTKRQDPSHHARPEFSFSKSGKQGFKQMILNLATTGASAFPIWMEALSGNVSDKKSLHAAAVRMKEFCVKLEESPEFLFVGDSAFYDACAQNSDFYWLTRVPETHKAAKDLLMVSEDELMWQDLGNGYKQHKLTHKYRGQTERWMLIFSEACFQREIQTLEKKIQKNEIQQNKKFKQLQKQYFKCEKDAHDAAQKFLKTLPFHEGVYEIESVIKMIEKRPLFSKANQGKDTSLQNIRQPNEKFRKN